MGKVLVTGGAGFVGSHLTNALETVGRDVIILDNLSTGDVDNLHGTSAELVVGSVEDAALVEKCAQNCDTIFHLAALVSVPISFEEPELCSAINIGGTENVLHVAERLKIKKVIYMSSASVYGSNPILPQREDDTPAPESPYAKSKLESEWMCNDWSERTNGYAVSVRLFNGFGHRQRADSQYGAVIPRFLKTALDKKPITIFGNGEQTRDFIFIDDVVQALLRFMDCDFSGIVNLACGQETSILQLANMTREILKTDIPIVFKDKRKGDVHRSVADVSRLKKLGFQARFEIYKGIKITLDAMRNGCG